MGEACLANSFVQIVMFNEKIQQGNVILTVVCNNRTRRASTASTRAKSGGSKAAVTLSRVRVCSAFCFPLLQLCDKLIQQAARVEPNSVDFLLYMLPVTLHAPCAWLMGRVQRDY